jgi:hypothetical protein
MASVKQGAYVQYPSGGKTDGFADDAAQAMKNAKRFLPAIDTEQPKRWFGNLMFQANQWTPTVVNPAEEGGPVASGLFLWHLIVWVIAIALTSAVNFGVNGGTYKDYVWDVNAVDGSGATVPAYVWAAYSDGTKQIALFSALAGIFGVVGIIASTALYDANTYKLSTGTNTIITFLLNYSLVGSFFIYCRAAQHEQAGNFYNLALAGVLFHAYAVVLFYSCSAALETLALPRSFIPTLAISVQLVNYLEINDGEFHCRSVDVDAAASTNNPSLITAAAACSDNEKSISFWIPLLTAIAVGVMIAGRKLVRNASEGGSQVKNAPFIRSAILMLFLLSAILSLYKYAFMAANITDRVARMFGMLGLLLQFAIVTIVFIPSAAPAGNKDQISPITGQAVADVGGPLVSSVDIGV